jgi:uncharacterized protein (TIGR03435 family)
MGAGMRRHALNLAARFVRLWTRAYTLGMPADVRHARISDIDYDLWECEHDADRPASAFEILARLLLGMPDDLVWRFEHASCGDATEIAPPRRRIAVSAFTCSFALHVVALAGAAWLASWPPDRAAIRPAISRAAAIGGPALLATAPAASVSESPKFNPSEKDRAMNKAALLVGALVTTVAVPLAQQTVPEGVFEVATLRVNISGDMGWRLQPQPGGRLTGTNVPAAALIRFAYNLPDFQITGGPSWLVSTRFDVEAKAEGDPPIEHKRLMLRALLADEFKLTVHTETRELPVYALVMARSDKRLGAQLRRSETDCAREVAALDDWAGVGPATGAPRCGFFGFQPGTDLPKGRGGLAFRGLTLAQFAKRLVPMVRRSVIDDTGLSGYFDGDFDFVEELPPPPPPPGMPSAFGTDPFVSMFTVLPEQLGLKLDSRRGPVEVLVIDRVEPPKVRMSIY